MTNKPVHVKKHNRKADAVVNQFLGDMVRAKRLTLEKARELSSETKIPYWREDATKEIRKLADSVDDDGETEDDRDELVTEVQNAWAPQSQLLAEKRMLKMHPDLEEGDGIDWNLAHSYSRDELADLAIEGIQLRKAFKP